MEQKVLLKMGADYFTLRVERTWRTLKYEWLFLKDYHEFDELEQSLNEFVYYFNHKRIHQSLDYHAPR